MSSPVPSNPWLGGPHQYEPPLCCWWEPSPHVFLHWQQRPRTHGSRFTIKPLPSSLICCIQRVCPRGPGHKSQRHPKDLTRAPPREEGRGRLTWEQLRPFSELPCQESRVPADWACVRVRLLHGNRPGLMSSFTHSLARSLLPWFGSISLYAYLSTNSLI